MFFKKLPYEFEFEYRINNDASHAVFWFDNVGFEEEGYLSVTKHPKMLSGFSSKQVLRHNNLKLIRFGRLPVTGAYFLQFYGEMIVELTPEQAELFKNQKNDIIVGIWNSRRTFAINVDGKQRRFSHTTDSYRMWTEDGTVLKPPRRILAEETY